MRKSLSNAFDVEIQKWNKKLEELKQQADIYEQHIENLKLLKEKADIVTSLQVEIPKRTRKTKKD